MSFVIPANIVKGFSGQQPLIDAKAQDVANVVFLPESGDFDTATGILTLKGLDALGNEVTRTFQMVGSTDQFWIGWTGVKAQADNDAALSREDANNVKNNIVATEPQNLDNLTTGCRVVATSPAPEGWYKPVLICLKSRAGFNNENEHALEFFNNLNATDTDSWEVADETLVVNGVSYTVFVKTIPVSEGTEIKYLVKKFK